MNTIPHRKLPLRVRFPYTARIVCQIGDTVIELARFRRRAYFTDLRHWAEGREDRCWVERPLSNSETITCRPGAMRCERARGIRQFPQEGGRP